MIINWKRIFGFTKTGASVVGKYARRLLLRRETQRVLGVSLVGLATATILVKSLANIGGGSVLALNTIQAPKATIDASTTHSVQTPLKFTYESRGVSLFHSGADLVADTGTPVHPIMEGEVEAVKHESTGFGNHIIVKHGQGYQSTYAHLSQTEVEPGQKVGLDTELGKSGSTGFSTGPHLHLEIHQNGQLINPADLVPGVK